MVATKALAINITASMTDITAVYTTRIHRVRQRSNNQSGQRGNHSERQHGGYSMLWAAWQRPPPPRLSKGTFANPYTARAAENSQPTADGQTVITLKRARVPS